MSNKKSQPFGKSFSTEAERETVLVEREYVAEALEARILYSAAPAEMPQEIQEAPADVDTPSENEFQSLDSFADHHPAIPGGETEISGNKSVILSSTENLSSEEIEKLAEAGGGSLALIDVSLLRETVTYSDLNGSVAPGFTTLPHSTSNGHTDSPTGSITQQQLDSIVGAAEQRWIESGLSDEQIAALGEIEYRIEDLPQLYAGVADGRLITLDIDAYGRGWFIDTTPLDDSEFALGANEQLTLIDPSASEQLDLLTVVMHEQGHVLGLEDIYDSMAQTNLMYGAAQSGVRILPADGQAEGAIAGSIGGPAYFTGTITDLGDEAVDATVNTLREAVMDSNTTVQDDVITLGAGTFELNKLADGTTDSNTNTDQTGDTDATADLDIAAESTGGKLTIVGQGAGVTFIDGNDLSRIFETANGAHLTLRNLTLTGGLAHDEIGAEGYASGNLARGGAIFHGNGTLILDGVTFEGNDVEDRDPNVNNSRALGGAIYNNNGTIEGAGVIFDNNSATQKGGDDTAAGGAIFSNGGSASSTFVNSSFTNNLSREGGAIYLWTVGGQMNFHGTIFDGNEATALGGAMRINDGSTTTFDDTVGSVSIGGNTVIVTQASAITNNEASGTATGGGIRAEGGNLVMKGGFGGNDIQISNNSSGGVGGGLYIRVGSKVNMTDVTISDNTATEGAGFQIEQGGNAETRSELIGTRVTIVENTALTRGGGFRNTHIGALVDLSDSTIKDNVASNEHGGGFYTAGTVNLTNTEVISNETLDLDGANRRDGYGGGFFVAAGGVVNADAKTVIARNSTYGIGGGFVNQTGTVNLNGTHVKENYTIYNNQERHAGGFWNYDGATTNLDGAKIYNNSTSINTSSGNVDGRAGGFWNTNQGVVNITGATEIYGNVAEAGGGFVNESNGSVVNINQNLTAAEKAAAAAAPVRIYDNWARDGGGGFQNRSEMSAVNLSYVEVTGNLTELGDGGGINYLSGIMRADHLTVSDNAAGNGDGDDGGGIFFDNRSDVIISDSLIRGNHSADDGGGIHIEGVPVQVQINNSIIDANRNGSNWDASIDSIGTVTLLKYDNLVGAIQFSVGDIITGQTSSATATVDFVDVTNGILTVSSVTGTFESDGEQIIGGTSNAEATTSGTVATVRDITDTFGTGDLTTAVALTSFNNADGGGIHVIERGMVELNHVTISNNISTGDGGGIYGEDDTQITVRHSLIDANLAGYNFDLTDHGQNRGGGGIYGVERTIMVVEDSVIQNNEARWAGGGINLRDDATLTVRRSTFDGNVADNHGGAIYQEDYWNRGTIENSTFVGNYAGFERANQTAVTQLAYDTGTAAFTAGDTIQGQTSGAIATVDAILEGGATAGILQITMTSGTFQDDELLDITAGTSPGTGVAQTNGGNFDGKVAVAASGGSGSDGGGIYFQSGEMNVTHSTFTDNEAADQGGGIHRTSATLRTVASVVVNNTAGGADNISGGTITNSYQGSAVLTESTFGTVGASNAGAGGTTSSTGTIKVYLPDAGDTNIVDAANSERLASDQLGAGRPAGGTSDLGAVELSGTANEGLNLVGLTYGSTAETALTALPDFSRDGGATFFSSGDDPVWVSGELLTVRVEANGPGPLSYDWNVTGQGQPSDTVPASLTSGTGTLNTDTGNEEAIFTFTHTISSVETSAEILEVSVTITDTNGRTITTQGQVRVVNPNAMPTSPAGTAVVNTAVDGFTTLVELDYDGGVASGFTVGQTLVGATSGTVATIDAISGDATSGTLTITMSTPGEHFDDDENLEISTGPGVTIALANGTDRDVDDTSTTSLREAINQANISGSGDFVITFDAALDGTNIVNSISTTIRSLFYDNQQNSTGPDFRVGDTIRVYATDNDPTSAVDGEATIVSVNDNGNSGVLGLTNITGTFANNDDIYIVGQTGTNRSAEANGGLSSNHNQGGDLDITKRNGAVYIIGNGTANTILDGGAVDRVLDVRVSSHAVLKDLTITNGATSDLDGGDDHGGGFRSFGVIITDNVDVVDNEAKRGGGNVGGAFYASSSGRVGSTVIMNGGTISRNMAGDHGGGFYASGTIASSSQVRLTNVDISSNQSSFDDETADGGGFYFTGQRNLLDFDTVSITDNASTEDGGGFYVTGEYGKVDFDNVTITRNVADSTARTDVNTAAISTVSFNAASDRSDRDGGGGVIEGTKNIVTIADSTIGGARAKVADQGFSGNVAGGILEGNYAEDDGAGLALKGINTLTFIDTTFQGNFSEDDGGGFLLESGSTVTFKNDDGQNLISENFSINSQGGGFTNRGGTLNLIGTQITNNRAGDRIYNTNPGNVVGGGFYNLDGGTTNLTDITLTGNQAEGRGGGFYASRGTVNISSSVEGDRTKNQIANNTTMENSSSRGGAGFYATSTGVVNVEDATITGNRSPDDGGGIHLISKSAVNLNRVDITANEAQNLGGGIMVESDQSTLTLQDVNITGNATRASHGGGITTNGTVVANNVLIQGNRTGYDLDTKTLVATANQNRVGGGIYVAGNEASFTGTNVVIADNEAHGRGGGIYLTGGALDLENFIIRDNLAFNQTGNGDNARGGGLWISDRGQTDLLNGEISGNVSADFGGGIYIQNDRSRLDATNVTISGNYAGFRPDKTFTQAGFINEAGADGGGLFMTSSSFVTLTQVTIANNQASDDGGGVDRDGGTLIYRDSILAGNLRDVDTGAADSDNNATATLEGHVVLVTNQGGSINQNNGTRITTDPQLGDLAENGQEFVQISFDAQTGTFTEGDTVTGATSGATATISRVLTFASTGRGVLLLGDVSGNFQDNESLQVAATDIATAAGGTITRTGLTGLLGDATWTIKTHALQAGSAAAAAGSSPNSVNVTTDARGAKRGGTGKSLGAYQISSPSFDGDPTVDVTSVNVGDTVTVSGDVLYDILAGETAGNIGVTIDWGDGSPETRVGLNGSTDFSLATPDFSGLSHAYASAGSYTLTATLSLFGDSAEFDVFNQAITVTAPAGNAQQTGTTTEDSTVTLPAADATVVSTGSLRVGDTVDLSGNRIGDEVDIDSGATGSWAILGADPVNNREEVYIYRETAPGVWTLEQTLITTDNSDIFDRFGTSVNVDAENGRIFIGARAEDTFSSDGGAVWYYEFNSGAAVGSQWEFKQKITGTTGHNSGDDFGWSLDAAGDYLVVGARLEDSDDPDNQADTGGANDSGAVFVFKYDAAFDTGQGLGGFVQEQKLKARETDGSSDVQGSDQFGYSVAINEAANLIVVGQELEDDGGSNSGAAYVYSFDGGQAVGSQWSIERKLETSNQGADDRFGYDVDVSGTTVVGGARRDHNGGSDTGSVYVFDFSGNSVGAVLGTGDTTRISVSSTDTTNTIQVEVVAGVAEGVTDFGGVVTATIIDGTTTTGGLAALLDGYTLTDDAAAGSTLSASAASHSDGVTDAVAVGATTLTTGYEVQNINEETGVSFISNDDNFGAKLAIDGDRLLIGAYADDPNGNDNGGRAYIFDLNSGTGLFEESTTLLPAGSTAGGDLLTGRDNFGWGVALDGDNYIVGARYSEGTYTASDGAVINIEDWGAAYLFSGDPAVSVEQEAKLDGDLAGHSEIGSRAQFGRSVSIGGNYALVGAPEAAQDLGNTEIATSGLAFLYQINDNGTINADDDTWTLIDTIAPPTSDDGSFDQFGFSVSISETGTTRTLVVGAQGHEGQGGGSSTGAAYIYTFNTTDDTVTFEGRVRPAEGDRSNSDEFGRRVAISEDGSTLAVGMRSDDLNDSGSGAVIVYTAASADWSTFFSTAPTEDGVPSIDSNGIKLKPISEYSDTESDEFGRALAISGDRIVVGAFDDDHVAGGNDTNPDDNAGGTQRDRGTVYVYQRDAANVHGVLDGEVDGGVNGNAQISFSATNASNITQVDIVTGAGLDVAEAGGVVTITLDGAGSDANAIVSAVGSAGITGFSASLFLGNDAANEITTTPGVAGNDGTGLLTTAQSVVLSEWELQQKLVASNDGQDDRFGWAVDVDGNTIVVGAPQEDGPSNSGAIYVFEYDGGQPAGSQWSESRLIEQSDEQNSDFLGRAVAIDGDTIVAGAYLEDTSGSNAGSVYVYQKNGADWTGAPTESIIRSPYGQSQDGFGLGVAISGENIVVGAYQEDRILADGTIISNYGAAHGYRLEAPVAVTGIGAQPAKGSIAVSADGFGVDFDPGTDFQDLDPGDTEDVTFTYTTAAGTVDVTVTVTGLNDDPVANADTNNQATEAGGTANGTAAVGASGNVLTGVGAGGDVADSDIDGDDDPTANDGSVVVSNVTFGGTPFQGTHTGGAITPGGSVQIDGQYGTLTIHSDGTYSYGLDPTVTDTLTAGQVVQETFTYEVSDGGGAVADRGDLLFNYTFEAPDDTADGMATDSSGNGNDGTLDNLTATAATNYAYDANTAAVGSQSLQLSETGAAEAANLAPATGGFDFNANDWTFSGFYNRSDNDTTDMIFHLGNGDGFGAGNELYIQGVTGSTNLSVQGYLDNGVDPAGQNVNITVTGGAAPGVWNHVSLVHDATAQTLSVYLNGVLSGTQTGYTANLNNNEVHVGGHSTNGFGQDRWFNGNLDQISLVTRVLNDTEISHLSGGGTFASENTLTLDVNGSNDQPTVQNLPTTVSVDEEATANVDFSAAATAFADIDTTTDVTLTLASTNDGILTSTGDGTVSAGGSGTTTLTLTGTIAEINAYLAANTDAVQYSGATDYNGSDPITVSMNDGTGSGDESLGSIGVTVNGINDAPNFHFNDGVQDVTEVTVLEDAGNTDDNASYTYNNFVVIDDNGAANESGQTITGYTIVNNTEPALFQSIAITGGNLVFTTATNAFGFADITVLVTDDGAEDRPGPGNNFSYDDRTFRITVDPVSDIPSFNLGNSEGDTNPNPADEAFAMTRFAETVKRLFPTATSVIIDPAPAESPAPTGTFSLDGNILTLPDVEVPIDDVENIIFDPDESNSAWNGTLRVQYQVRLPDNSLSPVSPLIYATQSPTESPLTAGAEVTVPQDSGSIRLPDFARVDLGDNPAGLRFDVGTTNPGLFSNAPSLGLDGSLDFTPSSGSFGSSVVTLTLTDGNQSFGSQTFLVIVTGNSSSPGGGITFTGNSSFELTRLGTLSPVFDLFGRDNHIGLTSGGDGSLILAFSGSGASFDPDTVFQSLIGGSNPVGSSVIVFPDLANFQETLQQIVAGEFGLTYRVFDVDRLDVPIHGGERRAPEDENVDSEDTGRPSSLVEQPLDDSSMESTPSDEGAPVIPTGEADEEEAEGESEDLEL